MAMYGMASRALTESERLSPTTPPSGAISLLPVSRDVFAQRPRVGRRGGPERF